jgi:hypothetical protein
VQAIPLVSFFAFLVLAAPLLLSWPWWVIPALIVPVVVLRRHRWAMRWSIVASTVILGLLVAYPSLGESPAMTPSRWIDFAYYRRDLDAQVRTQHARGQHSALATVAIDGFISMASGIAYDESDELALPPGQQSARWRAAAASTELDREVWAATRLHGHYFWWDGW